MALRSGTLLLVFGLVIGSLAVAQAGRGLLNDDDKCYPKDYYYPQYNGVHYPKEHVKKCPGGKPEDCYNIETAYDQYGKAYAKVSKKPYCYVGDYDQVSISYYDQWGNKQCYNKYWTHSDYPLEVQCDSYINLHIIDPKYSNDKKVVYNECGYYDYYEPCMICDYPSSYKVKCEKKEEKEPEYDDKNSKRNLLSVDDNKVGRELLDDGKDKNKCYPKNRYYYPKPCPYGNPEYCFDYVSYKDYVKVTKKPCYDNYGKDKVSIYYTDTYGREQCSDGKYPFKAKCDQEVKLYILEKYNEYGYQMKKDKCNYDYYDNCSVCDYKVLKFPCKKENEYEHEKEKEYKD